MKLKDILDRPLVTTSALTALSALSGAIATAPRSEWYRALDKPFWQPPSRLFPIVWTALYTDVAVTSAAVIEDLEADNWPQQARDYRRALMVNLLLNQGWSWVFFRAHKLLPATVVAGLLTTSSIDLLRRANRAGKSKALALAPYVAWCAFATALTAAILRRNPRQPG
jgi:tryptophan-rich sensory protein